MKKILILLLVSLSLFGIEIRKKPKRVVIEHNNGGYVKDGLAWSSDTVRGKVYVMFYVDPDEKDKNEHFADALKAKKYDRAQYGSIAIVNSAATWKPDFVIEQILKSKQKKFPDTIYVMDKAGVLVKEWGLKDDDSDILVFDKDGKLLFYKAGKMDEADMQKVFKLIEERITWSL